MGATRLRKDLIRSRRRKEDDGEEEEGSVVAGIEEDSMSEGSAISDADDDADAEGSDGDDGISPTQERMKAEPVVNGYRVKAENIIPQVTKSSPQFSLTTGMDDMDGMMNGHKVSGVEDEGIAFESMGEPDVQLSEGLPQHQMEASMTDSIGERRRREHDEYKKKRDADPAFVPNRGGFFMHDHRSAAPDQNGFRPFGRGRGKGRGGVTGPFPPSSQSLGPTDAPWAHDLHEVVTTPSTVINSGNAPPSGPDVNHSSSLQGKAQPPNRSFSKTTRLGNIQIRVLLRGMSDPVIFSAVPVNQHTRLPHHRPPLRRDKPVRISLPEMPIRYIFPSIERSFIFIPRALRPNQQGFGRLRGRGSFGGGYSAFGGLSSRRTSAYAGSAYSPTVALSRRSSLVREVATEAVLSPGGSTVPRLAPVVRLPPAAEQTQFYGQQSLTGTNLPPTVSLPQSSAYPLPQKPTFRENRPTTLPMQHPKPQRTLQVADIDSPATLEFNPPQQQQQLPFHQQVPSQIAGQAYTTDYPHSRHPSHPSQASGGTPSSQIPDRAVHAPPFQPYPFQHPGFYPQQMPAPMYFYPSSNQIAETPSATAPAFVPGQQYHYPMPVALVPPPQPSIEPNTQGGMVAQEINGMVYYHDPSSVAAGTENATSYPPPGYMMTPPLFFPPPQQG